MAEVDDRSSDTVSNVDSTQSANDVDSSSTIDSVPHQLVAIPVAGAHGQIVYHIVPQYTRVETCVTSGVLEPTDNGAEPQVIRGEITASTANSNSNNTLVLSFNSPPSQSNTGNKNAPAKWSLVKRDPLLLHKPATPSMTTRRSGNTTPLTGSTAAPVCINTSAAAAGGDSPGAMSPGDSDDGMGRRSSRRTSCTCPNCRDGLNRTMIGQKKEHACHLCDKVYGKTSHLRAHLRYVTHLPGHSPLPN
jgi:hypothetical protein